MFLGVLWPPGSCVACPHAQRGHSCLPTRSCSFRVCSQLFCWLCWVGGFSFWLPSSYLGWNCAAGTCAASGFSVGCGAGLVGAVLDKTLRVSGSVG